MSVNTGLVSYRVVKGTPGKAKGEFSYAICDQEGNMKKVVIHGGSGKRDPLTGVSNAELVLNADGNEVVAINVDGDCIKRK